MQLVYFALNIGAGAETPFPDVSNLIGPDAEILGFVAYNSDQLGNTPDGAAVVSVADSLKLTVTLNKGSDQLYQFMPYTDLIRAQNAGIWYETLPFPIDLTKCIVKNNGAALAQQCNAAVNFVYRLTQTR
jgi:hypothetical protein